MKRANRLSRSRDFEAVYRHGRSVSSRFLVLYWFPQEEAAAPRFGFSVPRSVGGAVERNRIKRQLREVWRARLERVPAGSDYVLIVRPGLPDRDRRAVRPTSRSAEEFDRSSRGAAPFSEHHDRTVRK